MSAERSEYARSLFHDQLSDFGFEDTNPTAGLFSGEVLNPAPVIDNPELNIDDLVRELEEIVVPPHEHARREITVDERTIKGIENSTTIIRDARNAFREHGLFVPKQTKKGPSINYLLGVLSGKYLQIPVHKVSKRRLKKRVLKSQIIDDIEEHADAPLGFTSVDFCTKEDLVSMLSAVNPNSDLFEDASRHSVGTFPKNENGEFYIPVSCRSLVRFNNARLKEEQARTKGKSDYAVERRRAIRKKLSKLGHYLNHSRLYLSKSKEIINQLASAGANSDSDIMKRLSKLFNR